MAAAVSKSFFMTSSVLERAVWRGVRAPARNLSKLSDRQRGFDRTVKRESRDAGVFRATGCIPPGPGLIWQAGGRTSLGNRDRRLPMPRRSIAGVRAAAAGLAALLLTAGGAQAAEVRYLGHSALEIRAQERTLLVDPYLRDNPVAPAAAKQPEAFQDLDLILLTHGHADHLGDTAALLERTDAKVALNADLGRTLAALGIVPADRQVRFNVGGTVRPLGEEIAITMVQAVHSSTVTIPADTDRGEGGAPDKVRGGGAAVGYVIETADGASLYHAGDTAVFRGMSYVTEYYAPEIAFVPAGGRETMGPEQAAHALMNYLNVRRAVPMHYRVTGQRDVPERIRERLGDYPVEVLTVQPGEVLDF
jgi:L-ascorbate metabolism protein UlaG (beta-lactamase superfamily)